MTSIRFIGFCALALSVAGLTSGCGEDGGAPPPDDGGAPPDDGGPPPEDGGPPPADGGAPPRDDIVAPTVISTIPDAAAKGVLPDVAITIEFGEAMEAASVEAAYVSTELPASDVSFDWDEDGTTLTIVPNHPLEVEVGAGTPYAVAIGTGATDLAGNPLAATFTLAFETAALKAFELAPMAHHTGTDVGDPPNTEYIWAGDLNWNEQLAGVASFNLADLGAGVVGIAEATFTAMQSEVGGTPYEDLGGTIQLHSIFFMDLSSVFETSPGAVIGPFSTSAGASERSLDVTDAVVEDWALRFDQSGFSQFQLRFEIPSDDDGMTDYCAFATGEISLTGFIYVIP